MARNKYPEETVELILDVALELFLEKGYDKTTIQDIVDNLHGLTKGAVYHHFKSKEDIFAAVMARENAHLLEKYAVIRDKHDLTGIEKLQAMFEASSGGTNAKIWAAMKFDRDLVKNSRLLGMQYQSILAESAPIYIEPIIQQGMADGTICTEHPQSLAEVMLLLVNLWVNPLFHTDGFIDLEERLSFFIELTAALGAPIDGESLRAYFEDMKEGGS